MDCKQSPLLWVETHWRQHSVRQDGGGELGSCACAGGRGSPDMANLVTS